ncbi:MAG: amidohydrolase family protein [Actinomycetota bacterium]|nr:amidohydrolase family protein [Actinomycetota bacterium]
MRIIDAHAHVFPDDLAPKAVPALEAGGILRARYDGTIAGLKAEMRRTGVGISVIQPVATKPSQVRSINEWVATLASESIIPFGAMHPDLSDPADEIARMAALGLRGFKLHPEHQAFEPHDPRLAPLYQAAVAHNMIVFFHAGADEVHDTCRGTPESFATLMDAFPALTVVLAHMGGYRCWKGVSDVLVGREVWFDTAFAPGHLPDADFVAMIRAHGADRVMFGSDGPWTDAAHEIAHLGSLGLEPSELESVLGGTAARLLGENTKDIPRTMSR